jgi:drug/metabolite transporter (DMT)-like permease
MSSPHPASLTSSGARAAFPGSRGLGPTRAVTYTYAISPLAVTFGAIFLDEPVTIWLALGAILVVGGIATAQGVQLTRRLVSVRPWRSARSPSAS